MLDDEAAGHLIKALNHYSLDLANGVEPSKPKFKSDTEAIAWEMLSAEIKCEHEAYIETCKMNQENGSKGGRPAKPTGK